MTHPELDKMSAVKDQSQAIGEFMDWLGTQGIHLMEYRTLTDQHPCPDCSFNDGPMGKVWSRRDDEWITCRTCDGSGMGREFEVERWVPTGGSITEILARYFEIDLNKLEREKRAMLEQIRNAS